MSNSVLVGKKALVARSRMSATSCDGVAGTRETGERRKHMGDHRSEQAVSSEWGERVTKIWEPVPTYSPDVPMSAALAHAVIQETADNLSRWKGQRLSGPSEQVVRELLPLSQAHKRWRPGGLWRGRVDEAFAFLGLLVIQDNWNKGYTALDLAECKALGLNCWFIRENLISIGRNAQGKYSLEQTDNPSRRQLNLERKELDALIENPMQLRLR